MRKLSRTLQKKLYNLAKRKKQFDQKRHKD